MNKSKDSLLSFLMKTNYFNYDIVYLQIVVNFVTKISINKLFIIA